MYSKVKYHYTDHTARIGVKQNLNLTHVMKLY